MPEHEKPFRAISILHTLPYALLTIWAISYSVIFRPGFCLIHEAQASEYADLNGFMKDLSSGEVVHRVGRSREHVHMMLASIKYNFQLFMTAMAVKN